MPLLAYWLYKNYIPDLGGGGWFNFNSNQPRLHGCLSPQDRLWLCTRCPDHRSLVVACLTVQALTINAPGFKYGRYRVWGDRMISDYFADDGRDDTSLLQTVLRLPGEQNSGRLMQSMQAVRELDEGQENLLMAASQEWRTDTRIKRMDDELRWEQTLYVPEIVVGKLTVQGRNAVRKNARELKELYGGRCQVCAFDALTVYGQDISEVHHLVPYARGGSHDLQNLCVLCPNHHRIAHACDAVFDWNRLGFLFPNQRYEPLSINRHLVKANLD